MASAAKNKLSRTIKKKRPTGCSGAVDSSPMLKHSLANPVGVSQRIERLLRLIIQIQTSRRNSADTLATQLGVSRRTVFRDLRVLQKAGVPLANAPGYGYRLDPDFDAALRQLGESELLGLLLLDKIAEALPELPLLRPAHEAVTTILAQLPSTVRGFYQEKLRNVSYAPGPARLDREVPERFDEFQQAIENRTVCVVSYEPVAPHQSFTGRIHPLHLHFYKHSWYVLAFSEKYDEVRMFNLSRFTELQQTDRIFSHMPFSIEDYLDDAWGVIPGGRKYDIEIRFSERVARNVSEIDWHRSQKAVQHHDGSCTLRFRVNGLDEIKWWILGYGSNAEVIAPIELREIMRDLANEMVVAYNGSE